ncbi:hypothetical protein BMR11_14165 [Methylococcaceae bacterium CS5]|nr:hypothetical protein BMR11_14165 [Methylococcaceae bacterium CS5]
MTRIIIAFSFGFLLSVDVYANVCDDYLAETNAISGIVPRIENGQLRSLSMYGIQSFIAPKSSLINKARRQAELKAKRNFSEWIKTKIKAGTFNEELMENLEKTSSDGSTEGNAEEITKYADQISSNTSSVLSGIIKLDECVDKVDKAVYVRMGWKPSLSEMAARAAQTIKSPSSAQDQNDSNLKTNSTVTPTADGAGVKIISVTVEGTGTNSAQALNTALKQAVSQVFGQQFSTSTMNMDSLVSEEKTTSKGGNDGSALETTVMTEAIRTKTKGMIHSYNIVSSKAIDTGVLVTVSVNLAKYDKGIDTSKKTLVILLPTYKAKNTNVDTKLFTESLQDSIESQLSSSNYFNILDRESLPEIKSEMEFIAKNGDISEIARIGNMAGADRIVITSVMHYSPEKRHRKVGDMTIISNEFNATIAIKVIDPATSRVVLSRNVVFNRHKLTGKAGIQAHINMIANKSVLLINKLSGKVPKQKYSHNRGHTVSRTEKEINQKFEKLRSKSNNDW